MMYSGAPRSTSLAPRLGGALLCFIFLACSAEKDRVRMAPVDKAGKAVLVQSMMSQRKKIPDLSNRLDIRTGTACAEGKSNDIYVNGSEVLPERVVKATVIVSGWKLKYLDSDHHIGGISTEVRNVRFEAGRLTWEAGGSLQDKDYEDRYEWCYWYTVLGWPADAAVVLHQDTEFAWDIHIPLYASGDKKDSALAVLSNYVHDPTFVGQPNATVLPRGFAMWWDGFYDLPDHHLLQLAFHQGAPATFIEAGKEFSGQASLPGNVSQVDNGFVSWDTTAIFKDNDRARSVDVSASSMMLAGEDIRLFQPPFTISPDDDYWALFEPCSLIGNGGEQVQTRVVTHVPFEEAVPVLTGWDIRFPCDDEHVKEIGVWLGNFNYERGPLDETGTLTYDIHSILCDKDCEPFHRVDTNVSVLGIYPTRPRPVLTP